MEMKADARKTEAQRKIVRADGMIVQVYTPDDNYGRDGKTSSCSILWPEDTTAVEMVARVHAASARWTRVF